MKIGIVGATSHVAKTLIERFAPNPSYRLVLFARKAEAVTPYWDTFGLQVPAAHPLSRLEDIGSDLDVIINCVGFGTPSKVRQAGGDLFYVAEEIDGRITSILRCRPQIKYIDFSSGAVYGTAMTAPASEGVASAIELAPMPKVEHYRIAKIYQEAKHRALEEYSIVDIRLFNYFSRHLDLSGGFLMGDVVRSLREGQTLEVSPDEIYRDFISPDDLYALVSRVIGAGHCNCAIDTFSLAPISKSELLEKLAAEFGLRSKVSTGGSVTATGTKPYYYSEVRTATSVFGYQPTQTSWGGVRSELTAMGFGHIS